jgi:hypothetical protein
VIPVNGVASFSGCRINTAGTATLTASAVGLDDPIASPSIVVVAGTPERLVFAPPPSAQAEVDVAWPQQPAVAIQDAFGNVVSAATTPVSLALASGPGALACSSNPVTPVAGVAQFAGCRIDTPGVVSLTASTTAIAGTTTQPQVSVQMRSPAIVPATDRWALLMLIGLMLAVAAAGGKAPALRLHRRE